MRARRAEVVMNLSLREAEDQTIQAEVTASRELLIRDIEDLTRQLDVPRVRAVVKIAAHRKVIPARRHRIETGS
jgi:hypothetical protein